MRLVVDALRFCTEDVCEMLELELRADVGGVETSSEAVE